MGLVRYKCTKCQEEQLVFFGEEYKLKPDGCETFFEAQPNLPLVVHATNSFMATELQLDSMWTIHDLDRQLNIEAYDEAETKAYNKAIINF